MGEDEENKKTLREILTKIVSGLFDTKVLLGILALAGTIGTYSAVNTSSQVDVAVDKQAKTASIDSSYRTEQRAWRIRIETKIDSLISQHSKKF